MTPENKSMAFVGGMTAIFLLGALLLALRLFWPLLDLMNQYNGLITAGFTVPVALATVALFKIAKQQELATRVHERAYLSGGGPCFMNDGSNGKISYLTIENYGRTPAFLKRVDWGLCPKDYFRTDLPVSELLDRNLFPTGVVETRPYENIYPPEMPTQPFDEVSFPTVKEEGTILFGRYVYRDVFNTEHFITFKLELVPDGGSKPLTGCYSDWS